MMVEEVFNKLTGFILKNVENTIKVDELCMETPLEEMGVNSLSFIKIIIDLEMEFGFEISDEDLSFDNEQYTTLGSFVNYIIKRIDENN